MGDPRRSECANAGAARGSLSDDHLDRPERPLSIAIVGQTGIPPLVTVTPFPVLGELGSLDRNYKRADPGDLRAPRTPPPRPPHDWHLGICEAVSTMPAPASILLGGRKPVIFDRPQREMFATSDHRGAESRHSLHGAILASHGSDLSIRQDRPQRPYHGHRSCSGRPRRASPNF